MVDILDDVIGNVVESIHELGMWENTLIIFMSDNGGETQHGDNTPLCGNKNMLWEGGVRSPTFIAGGYLTDTMNGKMIKNELIHVTDWYPTIISMLGNTEYIDKQNNVLSTLAIDSNDEYIGAIDGINQWSFLNGETNDKSLRNEVLYNIDPNLCVTDDTSDDDTSNDKQICGAIRQGKYKYIIANRNDKTSWNSLWQNGIPSVNCGSSAHSIKKKEISSTRCQINGCLFDLEADPCELSDISDNEEYTEIIATLHARLSEYYDQATDPLEVVYQSDADSSDPNNNDGYWEPWLDLNELENNENPYKKLKPSKLINNNNNNNNKLDVSHSVNIAKSRFFASWNTTNGKYIIGLAFIFSLCTICTCFVMCKTWYTKFKQERKELAKYSDTEFSPLLNESQQI